MFCWFLGTALAAVWFVFRDPNFDVRGLLAGAVLPLLDGLTGGAWVLHTLVASLAVLAVVMAATVGRRPSRGRWLGVPIGMMLHLVFDGAWTNARLFAWPFGGWSFADVELPELARGWWSLVLELIGIALLVWFARRAGLGRADRRADVLRTGRWYRGLAVGALPHSRSC